MTRVVNDAVHTNKFLTSVTEMLHQLLCVAGTEVGLLEHLLLPLRVVKSDKILWQLLRFEWFCDCCAANRTDSEPLLFNLD